MKKLILGFIGGLVFISCNNNGASTTEVTKDTSTKEVVTQKMSYPYTIDHPDNWETGNPDNTMNVLMCLKAYENGNINESMKYFGDSINVQFDGLDKMMSNDSLKAMFNKSRSALKSMNIKMDDWESVISKDKKDEWVTIWYRQKWQDNKGNTDSVDVVNDLKMKDGKIIKLDEYTRKIH